MSSRLSVAQIVIEAETPLSIASGAARGTRDSAVVTDAWGLPAIPGASLAGVLRAAFRQAGGAPESEDRIFGFVAGDDGARSALEVSFATLHGSDDRPLTAPYQRQNQGDSLAIWFLEKFAKDAPIRHRVRINERGVADTEQRGKFDRDVVPRGARFTFEIRLRHDDDAPAREAWDILLDSISGPSFRLGGMTRAGLGAVVVRRMSQATFDLSSAEGLQNYSAVAADLARFRSCAALQDRRPAAQTAPAYSISLAAEDFWRIGQSAEPLRAPPGVSDPDRRGQGGAADMSPYTEPVITWSAAGKGALEFDCLLVPATSIKGALRHRTAFHFDRLTNNLVERGRPLPPRSFEDHPAIVHLFGSIEDEGRSARRGRVIIDDVLLPLSEVEGLQTIAHNSIDRFTGGVRDKILFSERMVFGGRFTFLVRLESGPETEESGQATQALEMAIADLSAGLLPLGAAGGRGHGRMNRIDADGGQA